MAPPVSAGVRLRAVQVFVVNFVDGLLGNTVHEYGHEFTNERQTFALPKSIGTALAPSARTGVVSGASLPASLACRA